MFIDAVSEDAATGPLAEYYQEQHAAWGFLPNFASAFSSRPDVAKAWNTLNVTIREGMERRRYEIATIAAARALHSTYCTVAHSKFLRDVCDDADTMQAIAHDPTGASLSAQDRAVYEFATKVATAAWSIASSDIDALRAVGLADPDIADIVFAVAARSFFTRVVDGLGAPVDTQIAATFTPALLASMVVGRAAADG